MKTIIFSIIFICVVMVPLIVESGIWPESARVAYIERCKESLSAQGIDRQKAQAYCSCITEGMEREFSTNEYPEMMRAEPNPSGDEYDRRLYKIMMECNQNLKK